jgi:trk system potassium uptake protein
VLRLGHWDVPQAWRASWWHRLRPEQFFVASFAVLIFAGTLGLKLLPGLYRPGVQPLGWLDSLFTITSAVCVTGLTVVDTASTFGFWGQLWLLIFVQLGGLGVIVLSSFIIIALGGRLSLRAESVSAANLDVAPSVNRSKLIRDIVAFTLIIELFGAILLFILWTPYSETWESAVWPAVFHSVSAFCNAGFSVFVNGFTNPDIAVYNSSATMLVVGGLIILGGVGFLSLEELYRQKKPGAAGRMLRLSVHTKVVLVTTIVLIVGGAAILGLLEWTNDATIGNFTLWDKINNAIFMSITARTAGFNTIDYGAAHASTNFVTIILMSIGGSPGSTAGGMKTTTFALIALLAWSRFRRQAVVSVFDRTIPNDTIQGAVGLFVFVFGLMTIFVLLMTITENIGQTNERLLPYMFEVSSAFNTVGLSMNVTSTLSDWGKLWAIGLMFLGRVGPLTFAAAIALPEGRRDHTFRFAKEDVVVG